MQPFDLNGLRTYPLQTRPSKVFVEELGRPCNSDVSPPNFFDSLPKQLAANSLRRLRDHLHRAHRDGRTVAIALGGHVIKTGCAPYLIDWVQQGIVKSVSMNGSAAIHDFELAFAGKTSEDVAAQLSSGAFGMARETADAFAVASERGVRTGVGLGKALGEYIGECGAAYPDASLVVAAHRAGIPCTVHVALGTDIIHMHPHVSGAALGESSLIDFRLLCAVVTGLRDGVWMNIGSAVVMPEVFLKAVAVARNFGHDLEGLVCANLDKEAKYRTRVNVLNRPSDEGIELIGHHEILIPLLHWALACAMVCPQPNSERQAA